MSSQQKGPADWRKHPRKPVEAKRTERLSIRVSPSELARIKELATQAKLPVSDYVIARALGEKR